MINGRDYFEQNLSFEVWKQTYKWETDNNIIDTFNRVSSDIVGDDKELKNKIFDLMYKRKYVPGGRILSNAGTNLKGTTMINCFVSGFEGTHQDSIDSIYTELHKQAKILKSEGGYGINVNVLRPRGSYINGIGVESPGAVEFLKLWDSSSQVVTSGSGIKKKTKKGKNKIRKGAQMVTLDVRHPSIIEYIEAKRTPGELTKFNMSVLLNNKFMNSVLYGDNYRLWFPDTSFEKYDEEWDGDFDKWEEKKYPIVEYDIVSAPELFDKIMKSNYNFAEPGVIFIDTVNKMNNLNYKEKIFTPNPCGEQYLPANGSCNLGSINLTQYIKGKEFDLETLSNDLYWIVKFHDNIIDKTLYPLDSQKVYALDNRRIGIGIMGYGSSLFQLKKRYGSEEALKITEEMLSTFINSLYSSSALLASERGSFKNYDKEKYLNNGFIKNSIDVLNKETISLIEKYGIRNSVLSTIAPTGNTGILTNMVSGGLEPVFQMEYNRTVSVQNYPDGLQKPKNIDFKNKIAENADDWEWTNQGHYNILKTKYNNNVYYIDESRGLSIVEPVMDYSYYNFKDEIDKDKELSDYVVTVFDLKPIDHIKTMELFAKYIDNGISKTINVPNNITYDEFKKIYIEGWKTGTIKGLTTYRDGTMTAVLSSKEDDTSTTKTNEKRKSPRRPKEILHDVYRFKIGGEKWIVFLGTHENNLYEIFAGKINGVLFPEHINKCVIEKVKKKHYKIKYENEIIVDDFNEYFKNNSYEALTRLISQELRHGVDVHFIIEQLQKAPTGFISFERSIARGLKKYIKNNTESGEVCSNCGAKLVYTEGCLTCVNCGTSKCG